MVEKSFSARISSKIRCYSNAELADDHFMLLAAQGNVSTVQRMHMELFPGRDLLDRRTYDHFYGVFQVVLYFKTRYRQQNTPYNFCCKRSSITQLEVVRHAIDVIYFIVQLHTLKNTLAKNILAYWRHELCCSKCLQEMTIHASEALSCVELFKILYCLNAVFSHPHFFTKSTYLGPSTRFYIFDTQF